MQCDIDISILFNLSNFISRNSICGFPFLSFITCALCQDISNLFFRSPDIALNIASFAANLPA
nr:MAG TPA: hypothetical protein [Caudoviricetes sp.]